MCGASLVLVLLWLPCKPAFQSNDPSSNPVDILAFLIEARIKEEQSNLDNDIIIDNVLSYSFKFFDKKS